MGLLTQTGQEYYSTASPTPLGDYQFISLEDVINNFEPRVSLGEVVVNADPDEAAYDVTVEFSIVNQPPTDTVQLNLFLERLR